jgi:RsiW-degrading membrane proteinase PrsW (M82 family)
MNETIRIIIYTSFALLPGLIWLLYYINKDKNPEPKRTILKVFILGALTAFPVFFLEYDLMHFLDKLHININLYYFIQYFFIVGIVEEFFKYFAFRIGALRSSELNEPVDVAIYMIVAALGFATAENIVLFTQKTFMVLTEPATLALFRFITANFLHVLCSGILGFAIAISFYRTKYRKRILFTGFFTAVVMHGAFDFFLKYSIIEENGFAEWSVVSVLIVTMLVTAYLMLRQALKRLNNLKGVCKIETYDKRKQNKT